MRMDLRGVLRPLFLFIGISVLVGIIINFIPLKDPREVLRINLLFFFLHFISLSTILLVSTVRKDATGFVYMLFLILKLVVFVILLLMDTGLHNHFMWYVGIYWFYLFMETAFTLRRITQQDKNHEKKG